MKIKTISAEVKLSKNFQTFGASMVADLEVGDDVEGKQQELFARCRKIAVFQRDLQ